MTHVQHTLGQLVLVLIVSLIVPVAATAQPIISPRPGTALRAEVLDALRPTVENEANGPVVFVVSTINVMGNWAYVSAEPQRPDGRKIDWRKTKFRRAFEADAFSGVVLALLHQRGGRWTVTNYAIGPTDVAWIDWMQKHDLPEALFNSR